MTVGRLLSIEAWYDRETDTVTGSKTDGLALRLTDGLALRLTDWL